MDRTACTESQCLYKGDLYLYLLRMYVAASFKALSNPEYLPCKPENIHFFHLFVNCMGYCEAGEVKIREKFTLEQTTKAQRSSRGIALLFL